MTSRQFERESLSREKS